MGKLRYKFLEKVGEMRKTCRNINVRGEYIYHKVQREGDFLWQSFSACRRAGTAIDISKYKELSICVLTSPVRT